MRGLLLKDIYLSVKYCRSILLIVVIFSIISVLQRDNAFFAYYPVIIGSMLPMSIMAYDERSRWNSFCDTLPVTRAQVVSSKYIIGLMMTFIVVVITLAMQAVVPAFIAASSQSSVYTVLSMVFTGLICPAIVLPLVFKLGVEKGRIAYYIVIGGACGLAALASAAGDIQLPDAVPKASVNASLIAALIAAVIFTISWLISIRVYNKKEL